MQEEANVRYPIHKSTALVPIQSTTSLATLILSSHTHPNNVPFSCPHQNHLYMYLPFHTPQVTCQILSWLITNQYLVISRTVYGFLSPLPPTLAQISSSPLCSPKPSALQGQNCWRNEIVATKTKVHNLCKIINNLHFASPSPSVVSYRTQKQQLRWPPSPIHPQNIDRFRKLTAPGLLTVASLKLIKKVLF